MYDLKWLSSCLESESYACLAMEYGQITQREWCYSEVVGTGRVEQNRAGMCWMARPVLPAGETRSLPQDSTEWVFLSPSHSSYSPTVLHTSGWKPCRKFARYFPIAQALLHHYDVTPSLCFRILWKMGPRQPLPTKWNIFATLDMSHEGVRELFCFNQQRAKNTNTHFKAPGNLSFLPFSRLSWNHADMRTSKQHRGLGV